MATNFHSTTQSTTPKSARRSSLSRKSPSPKVRSRVMDRERQHQHGNVERRWREWLPIFILPPKAALWKPSDTIRLKECRENGYKVGRMATNFHPTQSCIREAQRHGPTEGKK